MNENANFSKNGCVQDSVWVLRIDLQFFSLANDYNGVKHDTILFPMDSATTSDKSNLVSMAPSSRRHFVDCKTTSTPRMRRNYNTSNRKEIDYKASK